MGVGVGGNLRLISFFFYFENGLEYLLKNIVIVIVIVLFEASIWGIFFFRGIENIVVLLFSFCSILFFIEDFFLVDLWFC